MARAIGGKVSLTFNVKNTHRKREASALNLSRYVSIQHVSRPVVMPRLKANFYVHETIPNPITNSTFALFLRDLSNPRAL